MARYNDIGHQFELRFMAKVPGIIKRKKLNVFLQKNNSFSWLTFYPGGTEKNLGIIVFVSSMLIECYAL